MAGFKNYTFESFKLFQLLELAKHKNGKYNLQKVKRKNDNRANWTIFWRWHNFNFLLQQYKLFEYDSLDRDLTFFLISSVAVTITL